MKLKLVDGQYLSPDQTWIPFKSILIDSGIIQAIDEEGHADTVIDCKNQQVIPALTDLNITLKKATAKESAEHSEIEAAVEGGVGTFCCSPKISPINDSPAASKLIMSLAREQSKVEILPLGALTQQLQGENLSEYAELKDSGCVGLSNAYQAIQNLTTSKRCFEYAHTFGLSVFVHPMEPSLYKGSMHSGPISTMLGLQGIPDIAESIAVAQLIMLARDSGVHLHLSQISCKGSVELIRQARTEGINVTTDVAVANLIFTHEAVHGFTSVFHCTPPLRTELDRKALLKGVRDGTIGAISSAHQPCENSAKQAPFAESAIGMSTVEHLIHYALKLDSSKELPFERFIKAMTHGACQILKRPLPEIKVGEKADLAIIVRNTGDVVSAESMRSSGKNSPLLGQSLLGQVSHTLHAGNLVFKKGV